MDTATTESTKNRVWRLCLFYHVKSVHKLSFHNLSIIQQINRKWAKHNVSVITTVSVLTNRDNIKFKDARLTTLVLSVTVKQDIAIDLLSLIFFYHLLPILVN